MNVELAIEGMPAIKAAIDDSGSETIRAFKDALPIKGKVSRWGDEIYFFVDFQAPLESGARSKMKVGEIAYWPNGPALAIFFGPTPASKDGEPTAASDCNVIGIVSAEPALLRRAREGSEIIIRSRD